MAFDREDYERQGAQVLSSGAEFRCSSDSIIKAVVMMARDNCHRFKSILDVGCVADPSYAREIAAMGKQGYGPDYTFNFLSRIRWKGPRGRTLDRMVTLGLLRRFSSSIAVVARKRIDGTFSGQQLLGSGSMAEIRGASE